MAKPGTPLTELRRGNTDWESFSLPSFYMACRARFSTMQPDKLRRYQTRKARNIVRYAQRYAPFFRSLYQDHDTTDVWSLPTIDKPTMMANLTTYNTLGPLHPSLIGEVMSFAYYLNPTPCFTSYPINVVCEP